MAKQALLDVLEQTIGKYVKNLDAESLNVAVWSGKIELHSLELNVEAVNAQLDRQAALTPNLDIPFRIREGKFQKFQVDVPWAKLWSKPVVLRAQGLHMTAVSKGQESRHESMHHLSEQERVRAMEELREKAVKTADDFRIKTNALAKLAENDSVSEDTMSSRLIRRIAENIQMEINDVHVSWNGSAGASAGVILESLQLSTTDEAGNVAFVDRTIKTQKEQPFLYKSLQIRGLGVYMDQDGMRLTSIGEGVESTAGVKHSYILAPVSFDAKLRKADTSVCNSITPLYQVTSELSSVDMLVSRPQLELAQQIALSLRPDTELARPLFPEYRPLYGITSSTAKEWWQYSFRCIRRLNGRTLWVEFFRAYQTRKAYIVLYKRNAHVKPWLRPLSSEERARLIEIEQDRSVSVEGLMMWRSIADAQVEKEESIQTTTQTNTNGSLFSSLFGSSKTKKSDEATPAINLTADELKELEAAAIEATEAELAGDAMYLDVKFKLVSFQVHLSSYNLSPITSLELGTVSASFEAVADGSYSFDSGLSSLQVHDKVTANSNFPIVVKNQEKRVGSGVSGLNLFDQAFSVHIDASESGDHNIRVVLRTFESIASPKLLVALKRLITFNDTSSLDHGKGNALLRQSMTGSVDLFYDAGEGVTPKSLPINQSSALATDLSLALVDAWKTRTKRTTKWTIDLDLKAPIIVVPENCTDQRANVLVFDLGHLRFQYGMTSGKSAQGWLEEQRRISPSDDSPIDYGTLSVSNLSFFVGKANYLRRLIQKSGEEKAIVEPVSLSLEFGAERQPTDARSCVFGVIPCVALAMSHGQLSRVLAVARSWSNVQSELFPPSSRDEQKQTTQFDRVKDRSDSHETAASVLIDKLSTPATSKSPLSNSSGRSALFHIEAELQRLSLSVTPDSGLGIETQLLSVSTALSSYSDGYSESRLSMGCFWIVDRLHNSFQRNQRVLVHSELPSSISTNDGLFAALDSLDYDAVSDSSKLAKVYLKLPHKDAQEESVLQAKFSSLTVNWNPLVIRSLISEASKIQDSFESSTDNGLLVVPPSPTSLSALGVEQVDVEALSNRSAFLLEVELEQFSLCLRSAQDDLPLFNLTMSKTKVSRRSIDERNSTTEIELGDLSVLSTSSGRTRGQYRTILGLAPEQTRSLLSIRYIEGPVGLNEVVQANNSSLEAFGEVNLSPMRMVYIHAQVMALVEYLTAGILGALATQVASSAATAAAELAVASNSGRKFLVKASGMEVVLPQAAYNETAFSVQSGDLSVDFTTMADTSCTIDASLDGLSLEDLSGYKLQEGTVEMKLSVSMPPLSLVTMDEKAMKVSVGMDKARFVLTKASYQQLLHTLDQNIGDNDLHLRDESVQWSPDQQNPQGPGADATTLTHAGVTDIVEARRMYVNVEIGSLGLELRSSNEEPLIDISAVMASIGFDSYPDEDKTVTRVNLKNLVCDDIRARSIGRQHRSLIYQQASEPQTSLDAFSVSYETNNKTLAKSVDVSFGSPCIVFIPDAVSAVLRFVQTEPSTTACSSLAPVSQELDSDPPVNFEQVVRVNSRSINEVEVQTMLKATRDASKLNCALKTERCRFILVDLGTDTDSVPSGTQATSVAETLVFEGKFDALVAMSTDIESNELQGIDSELHCEQVESYSALGKALESGMQIVEPTKASIYFRMKQDVDQPKSVDFRLAAMENVDTTLSMRNVALVDAIISSMSACFSTDEAATSIEVLKDAETQRLEEIAAALENDAEEESVTSRSATTRASLARNDSVGATEMPGTITSFQITAPQTKLTFINDLQGLDEPLFRVEARNCVANGKIQESFTDIDLPGLVSFTCTAHVSILADFFDDTSNSWQALLLQPWEITWNAGRCRSQKVKSRPSTTVDVECFPCHLSFSEQFLMGLASASRMWSMYSNATKVDDDSNYADRKKLSLAASAARKFVASLPYAIENLTGADAEYIIGDDASMRHMCRNGYTEYFRFKPPKGLGYGGKRIYGQDVTFDKSVIIVIGGSTITMRDIDILTAATGRFYSLENGEIIMINVVRTSKTVVRSTWSMHDASRLNLTMLFSF